MLDFRLALVLTSFYARFTPSHLKSRRFGDNRLGSAKISILMAFLRYFARGLQSLRRDLDQEK